MDNEETIIMKSDKYHKTRNGEKIYIRDLDISHLNRIISYMIINDIEGGDGDYSSDGFLEYDIYVDELYRRQDMEKISEWKKKIESSIDEMKQYFLRIREDK